MRRINACIVLIGAVSLGLNAAPAGATGSAPVVLILIENHSYGPNDPGVNGDSTKYIVGNPNAPYINDELIPQGALFTNYYANAHPSLPNYIDIVAGTNGGCTSDSCLADSIVADNLLHQLGEAGLPFNTFAQSMPFNCDTFDSLPYVVHHNPEPYFTNIDANSGLAYACPVTDVPFPTVWPNPLPAFSLVVPDKNHNMHSGSISQGDTWLSQNVPTFLSLGAIVIVTFDEAIKNDRTNGGGHVLTVMAGPNVVAGVTDSTQYSHFSLLAGLETYFGLSPLLASAATATPLPIPTRPPPPAPMISGFNPTSGGVGDAVTITGTDLTGATSVVFDGSSAQFTVTDDTSIATSVPSCATTGPITVTTPGGTATSGSNFTVDSSSPAPSICGFNPTSGGVGDTVTITGTDLTGATSVAFDGTSAQFTVTNDTSIATSVSTGATTGPISVTTPGGTATSTANFTVTAAPTITGFAPTSGPAGTSVTITGTNFTGATAVKFNGTAATFTINSATQITATVPSGATTGPISVTNGSGTGTSSTNFTVTTSGSAPTITGFTPTSGPGGTSVTITGTNFTGATAVKFNGTAATFIVNTSTQITATVASGATTGPVKVKNAVGAATSSTNFTVITSGSAPTITGFTPTSGSVGTSVTITGTNFTGATAVKFNGTAATFTVNTSTQMTATVASGATTGPIKIKNAVGAATSSTNFTVTTSGSAPAITGFTLGSRTAAPTRRPGSPPRA